MRTIESKISSCVGRRQYGEIVRIMSAPIFSAWRAMSSESSSDSVPTNIETGTRLATVFTGDLRAELALGDREVQRLGLVVRPRDRGRAVAHVEVHHLCEAVAVEAEVVLERRDRRLHDAMQIERAVVARRYG